MPEPWPALWSPEHLADVLLPSVWDDDGAVSPDPQFVSDEWIATMRATRSNERPGDFAGYYEDENDA
jgi:hypothetical protein